MATPSQPRLLLADDESSLASALALYLRGNNYAVAVVSDGEEAMTLLRQQEFDAAILDIQMPHIDGIEVLRFIREHHPATEAIMLTGTVDVRTAVECMKTGAFYYLTKPFRAEELLEIIRRAIEHRTVLRENKFMQSRLQRLTGTYEIIGTSQPITEVLKIALKTGSSDSSVLIQGAIGTGKELVAHFIHANSSRSDKHFVPIDCELIPESEQECELFGCKKGASPDAALHKQGMIELAHGGTIFIDNPENLGSAVQLKLLHFLKTGQFRRAGGLIDHTANVRLISATHHDLFKRVERGSFDKDLFYHLNVITINLPTLAERMEDIPPLVEYFLKHWFTQGVPKLVSPEAMQMLLNYSWPGNVRELKNVIERAVLLSTGRHLQPRDFNLPFPGPDYEPNTQGDSIGGLLSLEEIERRHVEDVLTRLRWNKSRASKILGISLKTLYTKIAAYHLKEK